MLKNRTAKMSKALSIALLGIVVSALLSIGNAGGQPSLAEAVIPSVDPVPELADTMGQPDGHTDVLASLTWFQCTPANVAVFDTRVHVKCTASSAGGIQYFAKSTADADEAARVLSLLSIAKVTGRTLDIRYDPADTSGATIGCQANDCRLIVAVGLL
jgi:hypothetical protein